MAADERLIPQMPITSPTLLQKLATVLPKDVSFKIYHLSTPPSRTSSIYSAPPGSRSDRTYCESHFLVASITIPTKTHGAEAKEVLIFAVEILIYSTAYDSTFFVSKADSTGYLHLLGLVKGTPSPIRDISATFLRHLVEQHQRPNIRSTISLFARAQDQYLFPGSIEYSGKHVLDDRGLVRWWCKVLDPLIDECKDSAQSPSSPWDNVKGYLIVPGLDLNETRACVPRKVPPNQAWTVGHPLRKISRYPVDVPPRCLIPHYPDDPKARFLDELDDEVTNGQAASNGRWQSVASIDQFWEMMAYRQECSAGRMVGFIWVVFTPKLPSQPTDSLLSDSHMTPPTIDDRAWDTESNQPLIPVSSLHTPDTSCASNQIKDMSSPLKSDAIDAKHLSRQSKISARRDLTKKRRKLTGLIIARQPRIKTENKNYLLDVPESTPYYIWKPEGRGQVILDESDYKRANELLLRLDFANPELATSSSTRWIHEVRSGVTGDMRASWGQIITGSKAVEIKTQAGVAGVSTLNMGLVRKKRKVVDEGSVPKPASTPIETTQVNVLSANMINKNPKV